jgi:4-hydroxy-3-polyprenylbenzoate decarboxylase
MGYRNLNECASDLEKKGMLVRINTELDPYLEIGCVQRRVYENGGPALLFTNVKGSRSPCWEIFLVPWSGQDTFSGTASG